jgi:hypothetical protein
VAFVEKPPVAFHPPVHLDRFVPPNGKLVGRILLGKDFDGTLGTGGKVYMNFGSNQGVKVGDYFRAVRPYSLDLKDPVDSLSFKASTSEDTQKNLPTFGRRLSHVPKDRTSTSLTCRAEPLEKLCFSPSLPPPRPA